MPILPTTHVANQADGKTKMSPTGEVHVTLHRGTFTFTLQAVVLRELDCDILGGGPFLKYNGIVLDMPADRILIQNKETIHYSSNNSSHPKIHRSTTLRVPNQQTLYPGDYLELDSNIPDHVPVAIEPRTDSQHSTWMQPTITTSVCGRIRIPNLTEDIIPIKQHDHIAQLHPTSATTELKSSNDGTCKFSADIEGQPKEVIIRASQLTANPTGTHHSEPIILDPDHQLPTNAVAAFHALHLRYYQVFNKNIGK